MNHVGCVSPLGSNLLHVLAMLNVEKKRENKENIRYQCGCILPTPDPARSTDRREADGERIRSRQDIRMDVSLFHAPQAGPTCLLYRKTPRRDKDVSGADRLPQPRSPSLFASWVAFWFDPERMIVVGFIFWGECGQQMARDDADLYVWGRVENYLMLRKTIFVLF